MRFVVLGDRLPPCGWTLAVVVLLIITPECGFAWEFAVVDSATAIRFASLKIDQTDRVHIGYAAGGAPRAKYALFNGSSWETERIDNNETASGILVSIDVDPAGNPHMVYLYLQDRSIRYARRSQTGWTYSEFEMDPDRESSVSMAVDASRLPHVSYNDGYFLRENNDLKYAHFDGSSWTTVVVDAAGQVGRGSSIALDTAGRPHISYYDETHVRLKYAHWNGIRWQVADLDSVEFIGFNFRTAIALDSQDHVHIIYSAYHYEAPDWFGRLKYAVYDGLSWTVRVVEEALPTRDFRIPAITLDRNDRPHVSYLLYYNVEAVTADLKYAYLDDAGGWHTEFVDAGDILDSDHSNSIDVDSFGHLHIAYTLNGTMLIHADSLGPTGIANPDTGRGQGRRARHAEFQLLPARPNPCVGISTVTFRLPDTCDIDLGLFDVSGRRVVTLARGPYSAGEHEATVTRGLLPAGIYVCRLKASLAISSIKLMLR